MNPRPGEIWLADLGLAAKTRPVVIVSRFDPDPPRSLVIYIPLTTQKQKEPLRSGVAQAGFLERNFRGQRAGDCLYSLNPFGA
jgi:mRNA interferase MazF